MFRRAGLEDARLWHIFSARTGPNDPLAGSIARNRSVLTVRTKPGQIFSYSNMGTGERMFENVR